MQKLKKKQIRSVISDKIHTVVQSFQVEQASKKTEKVVRKVSKELAARFGEELKKSLRKISKTSSASKGELSAKAI